MQYRNTALARALNSMRATRYLRSSHLPARPATASAPASSRQTREARDSHRFADLLGFLRLGRRQLTVGAAVVTVGFFGVTALPAIAAPAVDQPKLEATQSLQVNAPVLPDVGRADFKMSHFTPVSYPIPRGTHMSSGWGYRAAPCGGCSSFHEGLDWNPGAGYPVRAIANGVVTEAATGGGLGVHVFIKHNVDGEIVTSGYGHMQYGSMNLHVGQKVKRGQIIGRVGSTGASTGAHLHFILEHGDEMFDPLPWLRKHANS